MLRTSRVRSIVATLVLSVSVVACGGGSSSSSGTARGTGPVAADDPSCPVSVPGTSVNVEDTDTGAALVFVTTGDVAELRKRVATMAQMHNEHHGSMGALPDGTGGGGGHDGHDMSKMGSGDHAGHDMSKMGGGEHAGHAGGMIGVHSKASAAEVPSGAKIAFIANGADVAKLQSELRVHAKHFSKGTGCPGSRVITNEGSRPVVEPEPVPVAQPTPTPVPAEPRAPVEPAKPDPATVKAELLAVETTAYDKAKPVFEKFCASCHSQGQKKAKKKTLEHFDITTYPFAGHHSMELGEAVRDVLGLSGDKPTMPKGKPGAVKGDELALIKAWADAFDASHAGGAHEGQGHAGDHGHGHDAPKDPPKKDVPKPHGAGR